MWLKELTVRSSGHERNRLASQINRLGSKARNSDAFTSLPNNGESSELDGHNDSEKKSVIRRHPWDPADDDG
jgi:hypothetical protein